VHVSLRALVLAQDQSLPRRGVGPSIIAQLCCGIERSQSARNNDFEILEFINKKKKNVNLEHKVVSNVHFGHELANREF
jgi:hypothetical protein